MKVLLLTFLTIQAFGFKELPVDNVQSNFKDSLILSDSLKFSAYVLEIPKGWAIQEGCKESDCTILAPRDGNQDTFLENINIIINELPSAKYSVEKYTDYAVGYLPSVVENFKLIERQKLPNNSSQIIYSGKKSGYQQTWKQYYKVSEAKLFIITFASESPRFEEYQEMVETCLKSFEVLK